jgi:phosphopantetheinyl transferase
MSAPELASAAGECRKEKLWIHWCAKEAIYKMAGIPGLDLRDAITLDPFDYLCTSSGTCRATVRHDQRPGTVGVFYQVTEAYCLAWVLS